MLRVYELSSSIKLEKPFACVLGAGILGVATAYYLAKAGKSVVVIDRLPGAGLDTSFANGGQISVSHAEPWAHPSAILRVLKWMGRDDSPLLFRPKLDARQWWWLMSWLVECLPHRSKANTIKILELASYSRLKIQDIRRTENLSYDEKTRGILHFYRDAKEYDDALKAADLMREFGTKREPVSFAEIVALEPAFAGANEVVGGTYTASDESGDAHIFTKKLADICARMGVTFLYEHEAESFVHDKQARKIQSVSVKALAGGHYKTIEAENFVLALGAFSPLLAAPLGISLNIYPAKGYSVTIPVHEGDLAPSVSLTDDQYKLVYSRLGDRLRVAGTAELNGYSRELNMVRCNAILENVRGLFPRAGAFEDTVFWAGLRPATPSNVPYVGRSAYSNLFLNTGHGTLGWTMGAGSGHIVAGLMTEGR